MKHLYKQEVRRLVEAVRNSVGTTPTTFRQSIESYVARLSSGGSPAATYPRELQGYINKLALHPYKITDDDVEALKAVGYGEDAIFEITISASLGAGLVRLEKALELLKESKDATRNPG
jgi:alkylhydroperoxidase family enzyme